MDIKELKEDFINSVGTVAISSKGEVFKVGDVVNLNKPKNEESPKNGTIKLFTIDDGLDMILAHTQYGWARLSSIHHSK